MKRYSHLLFLMIFVKSVMAQPLDAEIKAINTLPPVETIHLHFDRTVYMPGDTIWFKAYLRQGSAPSFMSSILYVQLFDGKGGTISQKQLPVLYYSAQGFFVIPFSVGTSLIGIKAYTPFILNNHRQFVYEHFLPVLQKAEDWIIPATVKSSKPKLEFFAEGGVFIANTETLVACKATDENGRPLAIKGFIKDIYGDTLTFFQTNEYGMGLFEVKLAETELTAIWWTKDNGNFITQLPVPAKEGSVVHVEKNREGDYVFKVKRNPDFFPENEIYHLLVYTPGMALFEAAIHLNDKPIATGIIKADSMPLGIINFMLIDGRKNIISQRNIYHAIEKNIINPDVIVVEKGLARRQLNTIELEVADSLLTNMSVSVVDADLPDDEYFSKDIATSILLNAELTQNQTGLYKEESSIRIDAQVIDMLLLTHTWRKKASGLSDILKPVLLTESKFITLKGKISGLTTDELQRAGKLNMIIQAVDLSTQLITIPIDGMGKFEIDSLIFYDSIQISFSFEKKPKMKYQIDLEPPFSLDTSVLKLTYPSYAIAESSDSPFSRQLGLYYGNDTQIQKKYYKELKEVVVTGTIKSREIMLDETYTTGLFRQDRAIRLDVMNDPFFNTYTDIVSYLRAKVPGMQIRQSYMAGSEIRIAWRNQNTMVFIDEQYVFTNTLLTIPIEQVAYIKVFRPIFFTMPVVLESDAGSITSGPPSDNENTLMKFSDRLGGGGAIAIYTKRGKEIEQKRKELTVAQEDLFVYKGYSPSLQFYSPDYEIEDHDAAWIDNRKTLYWNPLVFTQGRNNKFTFQFYNNDLCRSYKIIVQGMDAKGRIVYYEKIIK